MATAWRQAAYWNFEDLRRRSSAWLRDKSLERVEELFEGQLLAHRPATSCRPPTPTSTTDT
jgi:hypothetical protein